MTPAASAPDTIAAIATAAGAGGVGIVRLSGPAAIEIAAAMLGQPARALDRRVRLGTARTLAGVPLDQVLAFAMRAPASFTGEDVAELHGHGGTHNLATLLAEACARGARLAEPGEFTRRAVLHGKLDLLRAEALLEVISAGSDRSLRLAQANLAGALGEVVAALEARTLALLAELEGWIDFPDEDLDTQSAAWIAGELGDLTTRCHALAAGFRHGRALTAGISVALVGPVNVGKSSLLNALVGHERALVSPAPGTTRDWLEVATDWDGVAVTLIDTAGLRGPDDAPESLEARGIALGAGRAATADVVLLLSDGGGPAAVPADAAGRSLQVRTKADLAPAVPASDAALATSAATGAGLAELRAAVLALAGVASAEGREDGVVTTARQHAWIAAAGDALGAARAAWDARLPPELIAVDLRAATTALATLRGVEVGDRMLDELFARFCIGK